MALLTFARHHDPKRVQMEVASLEPSSPEMASRFAQAAVPVHTLRGGRLIDAVRSISLLTKTLKPDVVVANCFRSRMALKLTGIGTLSRPVFWIHGTHAVMADVLRKFIYRVMCRHDILVFVSHAVGKVQCYRGHKGPATTIYLGVEDNPAPHRPSLIRQELGIPQDSLVIGYTAEFTACKRHRVLIEALNLLRPSYSSLHLMLIGNGALLPRVRQLADQLHLAGRIHFLGVRPDARDLLGAMDVYAHVCNAEGFGLAAVEAMLAGIPVVAANAGALPEFVQDQRTGLLFKADDAADLASKLRVLLRNDKLRTTLARNARVFCLEHFSPEKFAGSFTRVLEAHIG